MLTREQLLTATARRFKDLTVPASLFDAGNTTDQVLRCWSLTAAAEASMQALLIDLETGKIKSDRVQEIKARKFIATVGDETGNLIFTADDLNLVMTMPASLVDAVAGVCDDLNSFEPTVDALKKT